MPCRQQAVNFLRAVRGEAPPVTTAAEALQDLIVARDVHAAVEGRIVGRPFPFDSAQDRERRRTAGRPQAGGVCARQQVGPSRSDGTIIAGGLWSSTN